MEKPLSAKVMIHAFQALDEKLRVPVTLIMGGGGAMILAHKFPLSTNDVDAIAKGLEAHELDVFVKAIALEQGLPGDWLNPYFSSFSHTLPADYQQRLIRVFSGKLLHVDSLGREEMLIMKCFAHRSKDVAHAKQLLKLGVDLKIVETQMEHLRKKNIPGVQEALDFLDDLLEQMP
jgi:hypothetical protein